ncbi:uncharacterized protein CDV56_100708 [Aspergillus thermomutatus]|uniref:Wings apart-like protein C-terminal domain-containing protein n=1 Tax=Aspergillus thermomutatus TaxID=41047 RepID=A0A397GGV6_ASPTH|nr:uncharacterized protein CDV56_100708 [Aspergillus thermomutatus]RHZ50242.1 hypothetical protein CDV56_100708 [Aspergillus thermomutatus]
MKEDTERHIDDGSATVRPRKLKGNYAKLKVQNERNESPKTSNCTSEASEIQSPEEEHEHFPSKDDPPVLEPVDKMLHCFQGRSGKERRVTQNKRRKLDTSQQTQQDWDQDISHGLHNSVSRMARNKRDSSTVTDMSCTTGKSYVHESELKLQIRGQGLQQATSEGRSGRNEVSTTVRYLQPIRAEQTISKNKTLSNATEIPTSSSQFQSNSRPETRSQITARRRLVDSLGPLELSVEDAVRASRANDDTEVDLLPRHSPHRDCSSNSQPNFRPVQIATESANRATAETSGPVSSRVGGCRVTYARQRSFLDDTSIVDNHRPSEIPASTVNRFVQGQRKYGSEILSSHSSHLGDGESSDSGPVRGIHELRQAGDNSRFRSAIELIFEDIEDAYNTTSDQLVKLLMPERDKTIKFPLSRERFRTLASTFSILESYAIVLNPADHNQNYPSLSSLSRLHEYLNLNQRNQGRQLRMHYIRAILNLTNNDPNLCNEYATPELVKGLVKIVMSEIRDASDDISTGEDNSLNTIILVLGVLINMTEKSESARGLFLHLTLDSTSLIHSLLQRFYESVNSVCEAHTAPTLHRNVTVGYLSILLLTLCFSDEAISQVRRSLDNKGLTVVLSTAGKSSLTVRFVEHHFVESYYPTIENTFSRIIKYNGQDFATEIVDTAGQDEYSILNSKHFIGIHGYIIVYSVASRQSFEMVRVIRDKILNHLGAEHVPLVVVGNKSDLKSEQRQVSLDEGRQLGEEFHCAFTEASARLDYNVTKAFDLMIGEIEKSQNPSQPAGGSKCILM